MRHTAIGQMPSFFRRLSAMLKSIDSVGRRDDTVNRRVERKFSLKEVAELLDVDPATITRASAADSDFPQVDKIGREKRFDIEDVMKVRAMLSSAPRARKNHLFWRDPGDTSPIPVVCFSSLKGGSGKSISASHFAQYLSLYYGMRVGIMDTDPQATTTLYYANQQLEVFDRKDGTVASFMGVRDYASNDVVDEPAEKLNAMWQPTPWPGIRIIPGGPEIQRGDLVLYNLSLKADNRRRLDFILKDAIERWSAGYPSKTQPSDLRRADGSFDNERFKEALNETVDIIIIDQQPSLTTTQMNGIIAATNLAVVIGSRGFDLNSLSVYVESVRSIIDTHIELDPNLELGQGSHSVLVTNVDETNSTDREQFAELIERAPTDFLPLYAIRSVAVPNAAKEYKSNYEWTPAPGGRVAQHRFIKYVNAVNDALFKRVYPNQPGRGFQEIVEAELWADDDEEQAA